MQTWMWILLGAALVLAWFASRRAGRAQAAADEVRRDLAIRTGDLEEARQGLDVLRKLVALMAAGRTVEPEMVREGRLYRSIDAEALRKRLAGGEPHAVIDVRSDGEWAAGHIASATHIPLDALQQRLHEVPRDGRDLYVTCAGGQRSAAAADYLAGRGYLNVFNVDGGMNSWRGDVVREAPGGAAG